MKAIFIVLFLRGIISFMLTQNQTKRTTDITHIENVWLEMMMVNINRHFGSVVRVGIRYCEPRYPTE